MQYSESKTPEQINPDATEQIDSCPVCDSENWAFHYWGKSRYSEFWFRYDRCATCSLVAVRPRVPANQYEERIEDDQHSLKKFIRESKFERLDFDRNIVNPLFAILSKENRKPAEMEWLDVGCAIGGLLRSAQSKGFEVQGLELNRNKVSWVKKKRPDIPIVCGKFNDLADNRTFDVISADNVFEHIHDPRGFLQATHDRLNPEGLLVIRVPNYNTVFRHYFQLRKRIDRCYLTDPDAHPYNYTPSTLKKMIGSCGFEVLKTDHRFVLSYPLRHILAGRYSESTKQRIRTMKRVHSLASRLDGLLPFGGIDVTVFARKR